MALLENFINIKDVVGRGDGLNLWKCCKMKNLLDIKENVRRKWGKNGQNGDLGEVLVAWFSILCLRSFFLLVSFFTQAVTEPKDNGVIWGIWGASRPLREVLVACPLWGYSCSKELEKGRACLSKGVTSERVFLSCQFLWISISTKWDASKSQLMIRT